MGSPPLLLLGPGLPSGGGLSGEWCPPGMPQSGVCPGLSSWKIHRGWGGGGPSPVGRHSFSELMWARSVRGPRWDLERGRAPIQVPLLLPSPAPWPWLPLALEGSGAASPEFGGGLGPAEPGGGHRWAWPFGHGSHAEALGPAGMGASLLPPSADPKRPPQAASPVPAFSPTSPSRIQWCQVSTRAPLCSGSGKSRYRPRGPRGLKWRVGH